MVRNRTTVRRHAAGEALRHHGALETLIWSDTCGLSSCLSAVQRTRSFVLKAQYEKNVFVPGEGLEPSYSSLWARRDHQFRQPGIFSWRPPMIRGSPPRCCQRVQPVRESPCVRCKPATKNPVLRTGLVNHDAWASAVSVPAYGAGFLIETLEALGIECVHGRAP